jgi:DNA polymerase III, delta subunit
MSEQMLTLSFRPHSLDDLVGQDHTVQLIRKHIESKRIPAAWMFYGPSGSGKTTIARILALSLQCTHRTFGHPCRDCRKKISQFDIIEINSAEASGVDETESVISGAFFAPKPPSKYRVYIFDEMQKLSNASQSVLLKYLEDSPKSTVWIICTTEPGKILRTLRRRCLTYTISGLDEEGISTLVKRAIKFAKSDKHSTPLVEALLTAEQYSPGFIVMAVEKYLAGEKPEKAALVGMDSTIDTLKLCRAVMAGDWSTVRSVMKEASPDDARVIRASLGGYLKAVLLNSDSESKSKTAARGIQLLGELSVLEDGLQLSVTAATLYKLCQYFGDS